MQEKYVSFKAIGHNFFLGDLKEAPNMQAMLVNNVHVIWKLVH